MLNDIGPVSVVIVTFNSTRVVRAAIESIVNEKLVSCVFVVDNASVDNISDVIDSFGSAKIKLIRNANNLGFGVANNIALEQITTPYALLMNPDSVMGKGSVETLVKKSALYDRAGILSTAIFYENGNLQETYRRNFYERQMEKGNFLRADGDICAEFLSGAVLFFNMKIMKEVGFFDPNIFLFFEEDDLCMRTTNKGYELIYTPDAKASHIDGGSSGSSEKLDMFRKYHFAWSHLYVSSKYKGKGHARLLSLKLIVKSLLKLVIYLGLNKRELARLHRTRIAAGWDYFFGINKRGRV
tara:strand:- start:21 stop:914 length:894 start_codon:yes stop_codon:yes gene_type:complete